MLEQGFTFIDLFAGVGGFHFALKSMGGECVFASEIDDKTRKTYTDFHGGASHTFGDIKPLTRPEVNTQLIPRHDVLAAGFPCQPFSKSGSQLGVLDTRGTLFDNILAILENPDIRPKFVVLENVKNLLGPKHHASTWQTIKASLRRLGYWVGDEPTVYSPHFLPPSFDGAPQVRERVYIVAIHVGTDMALKSEGDKFKIESKPIDGWDPGNWNIYECLVDERLPVDKHQKLTGFRHYAFEAWSDFLLSVGSNSQGSRTLPGFPLWEKEMISGSIPNENLPAWKINFLHKNRDFFAQNEEAITAWRSRYPGLRELPESYRKFEWQAGTIRDLNETVVQFRPSGLRVKPATYLPALVAISQPSYFPRVGRYISVKEAASLQGMPPELFEGQAESLSFKQLGNAVSVPTVKFVFSEYLKYFASIGLMAK